MNGDIASLLEAVSNNKLVLQKINKDDQKVLGDITNTPRPKQTRRHSVPHVARSTPRVKKENSVPQRTPSIKRETCRQPGMPRRRKSDGLNDIIKRIKFSKQQQNGHEDNVKCFKCGATYGQEDESNPWAGCDSPACNSWAHYKCVGWTAYIGKDISSLKLDCPNCPC